MVGKPFFAYSTNYLVDVENAIIVDVEGTTAIRQAEVLAPKRMIERSMGRFHLYPAWLMGDSAYGRDAGLVGSPEKYPWRTHLLARWSFKVVAVALAIPPAAATVQSFAPPQRDALPRPLFSVVLRPPAARTRE
jgi:hypothetical protein